MMVLFYVELYIMCFSDERKSRSAMSIVVRDCFAAFHRSSSSFHCIASHLNGKHPLYVRYEFKMVKSNSRILLMN